MKKTPAKRRQARKETPYVYAEVEYVSRYEARVCRLDGGKRTHKMGKVVREAEGVYRATRHFGSFGVKVFTSPVDFITDAAGAASRAFAFACGGFDMLLPRKVKKARES